MLGRAPFRLTAMAAVLLTLSITLAVNSSGGHADGGEGQAPAIPEKRELTYPNLGSHLDQLAAKVEEGEASAQDAAGEAPMHQGESVAVTIYLSGNVDDVVKFLGDNGGDPRNVGEDYIEAYVPVSLLGPVSERPGVLRVREIIPPEPAQGALPIAGHGPPVHLSVLWNAAGYSGQGVKVGIIDLGFEGFGSLMGTELPATVQARCYMDLGRFTTNLADCEDDEVEGDNHGTIVAETVMDIAPEVSLYIAHPTSRGDQIRIVDWMVSEGVSVLNRSLVSIPDGPGDGTYTQTDSPLKNVDRAVDGGIIWVNGAGNSARKTWFGEYSDADRDGWIEFDGPYELNSMDLEVGDQVTVYLRWDDSWAGANRDLGLYLFDSVTLELLLASDDPQLGRAREYPIEGMRFTVLVAGEYGIGVRHRRGDVPQWIQVGTNSVDVSRLEYYTSNGSITSPAEGNRAIAS